MFLYGWNQKYWWNGLLTEQEELKRMDEANAFSALKAKDPYQCLQSVREDNNGHNQEPSSDHKSSLTDPSTPDT